MAIHFPPYWLPVHFISCYTMLKPSNSFGSTPDSKVNGANMEPIWGRQDPGGPHVGSMNFAIWDMARMIPMSKLAFKSGLSSTII